MLEDFPPLEKIVLEKRKQHFIHIGKRLNIMECLWSPKKSLVESLQKNFTKNSHIVDSNVENVCSK